MEEYTILQDNNDEGGETIYEHREYNIKDEKNDKVLRLEITDKKINITLLLTNTLEYNYNIKMSLTTIINKLELNSIKYSNLDLLLKLFDEVYNNDKLSIEINDETCMLKILFINVLKESLYEIKLYKNYTTINDKFNILFNQIQLLKNNNTIFELRNKINESNKIIKEKDEKIKEIKDNKDNLINELNNKIIEQEKKIKELENQNDGLLKNEQKIQYENKIKLIEEKVIVIDRVINKIQIIEILNNYNKMKEDINKLFDNKLNDIKGIIKDEIKKFEDRIQLNKYKKKLTHQFIKEPKNLKFKYNIITTNTFSGSNDIFEIFISNKDNEEYLASQNANNYNIDIFRLIENRKIHSLKGHKNYLSTIKYFINNKNKNEYLISGGNDNKVIIWDINDNYNIKCNIETLYGGYIYSCLLIFPENMDNNYIITSTINNSGYNGDSGTKIFLFNNDSKFVKYIKNTNNIEIYYLLSWYNKKNHKYYIIQFANKKIMINNLLEDESYYELIHEPEHDHLSGFIDYGDDNDYLYSSSRNGYIHIWDLYNKNIIKVINTNGYLQGSELAHIIKWNKKYIITVDINFKLIKIIDIENDSITDIKSGHSGKLQCIKKIYHPLYGESLLSSAEDGIIKLWTIEYY